MTVLFASSTGYSNVAQETTGSMTFYVNASTGSDSNAGTVSAPFRTVQKSLNSVPLNVKHAVTINIAAGTYSELLTDKHVVDTNAGGSLIIQGTSFLAVTPATGPGSGTFTSNSGRLLTLTAAGWTVNDLAGKWLKITSGTASGQYHPIVSNTATDIELSGSISALSIGNASFEIYTFGVTLSHPGPTTATIGLLRAENASGSQWQYINFLNTNGSNWNLLYVVDSLVTLTSCSFITNGFRAGSILNNKTSSNVTITRGDVYNSKATASSSYGFWVSTNCTLTLNANHVKGAGGANGYTGVVLIGFNAVTACNSCLFEDWDGTAAIYAINCNSTSNIYDVLIRNGKQAIALDSCYNSAVNYTGSNYFTNNSANGIFIEHCMNVEIMPLVGTGHTSKFLYITGNLNGIYVSESTLANVYVRNASDISSNTAWGVIFNAGTSNRNNYIHISSTVTMTGNVTGDFALDGSTNTSLATLRADPDKIVADTARNNSASSD